MATPVLMVMNMKGGVGKTTVALEISRALGYFYDKDVLLIDYDPQANASQALLPADRYRDALKAKKTLTSCLLPSALPEDPFSVVSWNGPVNVDVAQFAHRVRGWYYPDDRARKAGSLSIVPNSLDLMRVALNQLPPDSEKMLTDRWKSLIASAKNKYECIVIDCHPAGSFFTTSAILSANAVIIPVTSDGYAASGVNLMRSFIEDWSSAGGQRISSSCLMMLIACGIKPSKTPSAVIRDFAIIAFKIVFVILPCLDAWYSDTRWLQNNQCLTG